MRRRFGRLGNEPLSRPGTEVLAFLKPSCPSTVGLGPRTLPYRLLRLHGDALVVWPGMLFPNSRGY